ncbi:pleckstrin homology domain-containing family G member 5 isoform X3 [Strongylocentrotus purpuratus]|uniref:DH domain-containing protein n=1 Tax=Strongylocentrotus purpuratus TaxID=7668 RepID=A0A7M7NWN1_STRPU|nr:pleckstrin homology domain-containing family G member 5 isoform X3 [Strongylocentrotus purpuratus]
MVVVNAVDRRKSTTDARTTRDAEGSSGIPCRLHRRSALRRVHTLAGEPSSPRTGRNNRQRSPSTPNAPDPKMLQRGLDPGGRDTTKFSLIIELDGNKETIRLPARKDHDLKEVLEETLGKKGLTLDDIEIYIQNTKTNPLPKNDKGLRVPTEPLGGLEVFILPALEKTPESENRTVTATKRKKDLSAFLGVKDDVNPKVGTGRDRRMSVPAIVSAQMDPKLIKLQNELDHYLVQGLPGFPPLLSLQYQRNENEDPQILFMESSWKDLIDIDIRNTMSKRAKELQEGIWELLATEAKYIKQIRVIIDLYMCCLLNLQTAAILNEIETEKIFSNITVLELAHTKFWKENLLKIVEKARDSGKPMDPHDIATAFEDFSDQFSAYFKFCAEEDSCIHYVREKRQENNILRAFFEWCEGHNITRQMRLRGLGDLLIYPMQRVTKYHLMVDRVQKNCEDEVPKAALKKTFEHIVEFVTHINHEIKKEQERKKMEKVAGILEGYEVPNAPTGCDELSRLMEAHSVFDVSSPMPYASQIHPRWLLLEGALKLQEKTGRSTLYAFLFTDALVLAKQNRTGEKYRVVRSPMRVDQLEVIELKDGTGFAVLCVDDYDCAMTGFVAWPEKEKMVAVWMEKISQAKDLYNKCCSIDDDVEYFDEMQPDDPQTPIAALMEDHHLHPQQGFSYGSSPTASPHQSPQMERSNRWSSNSPSSHGSSSSLQRMTEEEEYAVQNGDKKLVMNGTGVQENNSNNQSTGEPNSGPPKTMPKPYPKLNLRAPLTKNTSYQETDFPSDSSLLGSILPEIATEENKSGLKAAMRRLSTGSPPEEVVPKSPMMSPTRETQQRIMSFESDDDDDEGEIPSVTTDIYYQPPKNKKEKSPQRQKGTVLSATPAKSKHHRPSMPNIHVLEKKEHSKTNGEGTLKKKKIWEKMQSKIK